MHLKNKAVSYHQWKYKWSLKYTPALACPMLPPLSLPQRCMEVPNPVQGSLRKFLVCDVFSKNSPQPTFFFTSNIAGFNFSAPALTGRSKLWSAAVQMLPRRMPGAPAHKAPAPQGPNHYRTSQKTPQPAMEPVRGEVSLAWRYPYTCSNAEEKKQGKNLTSLMAFSAKKVTWSLLFTFLVQLYMLWHKS